MKLCSVGILYGFIGSLCLASFQLISSRLVKDFPLPVILIIVYGAIFLVLFAYQIRKKTFKPADKELIATIFNVISHGLSAIFTTTSLLYITPFEATIISNLKLFFIAIISFIFLGEQLDILDITSITISFIGVLIRCKPDLFSSLHESLTSKEIIGIGLAFGTTLSTTLLAITSRMATNTSPTLISMYGSLITVIFTFITFGNTLRFEYFISSEYAANVKFLAIGLLLCVLELVGEVLMTKAYQMEEVTYVTFVYCMKIVWTYLVQTLIFQDSLRSFETIGCFIAFLGFVIFLLKKVIFVKFKLRSRNCLIERYTDDTSYENIQ